MKNKIKYIIIIALALIIIFLSFIIPDILFKIQDIKMEKEVQSISKTKKVIDVEAEKIYLVKAIHNIEEEYSSVKIDNKKVEIAPVYRHFKGTENDILKAHTELLKMKEIGILKDEFIQENSINVSYETSEVLYNGTYYLKNTYIRTEEYSINILLEEKTGKITNISIIKNKGEMEIIDNNKKREIIENYIKYLDLYIIGDWKFENNMLKSDKSQLTASFIQDNKTYNLSIHSSDFKSNNTRGYYMVSPSSP